MDAGLFPVLLLLDKFYQPQGINPFIKQPIASLTIIEYWVQQFLGFWSHLRRLSIVHPLLGQLLEYRVDPTSASVCTSCKIDEFCTSIEWPAIPWVSIASPIIPWVSKRSDQRFCSQGRCWVSSINRHSICWVSNIDRHSVCWVSNIDRSSPLVYFRDWLPHLFPH